MENQIVLLVRVSCDQINLESTWAYLNIVDNFVIIREIVNRVKLSVPIYDIATGIKLLLLDKHVEANSVPDMELIALMVSDLFDSGKSIA